MYCIVLTGTKYDGQNIKHCSIRHGIRYLVKYEVHTVRVGPTTDTQYLIFLELILWIQNMFPIMLGLILDL